LQAADDIRLTPTSFIVLGLLSLAGEATPYELKRMVAVGVGNLWSLQHAQLYTEPERLARAGYLTEKREAGGRRRKRYALTPRGRRALADWVATPTDELTELRDPGLLRLFFGADPEALGAVQLEVHERKLREYEETRAALEDQGPPGPGLTLEAGIGHEREFIRFWRRLAGD
jgi:PadR family transcriptional regulator, regulatory protein AphA